MKLPTEKTKIETDFARMIPLIYGKPGIGKSTLCSKIPGALFCATEPGHKFMSINKVDINNWQDFIDLRDVLTKEKHQYTTLVFDTADILFKHASDYVCKKLGVIHPLDIKFGKAHEIIRDEFRKRIDSFKEYGLFFISHEKEPDPETKPMDHFYDSTLSKQAKSIIYPMCDFILRMEIDNSGKRMLHTKLTNQVQAKDRTGKLPEKMIASYESFQKVFSTVNSLTSNNV